MLTPSLAITGSAKSLNASESHSPIQAAVGFDESSPQTSSFQLGEPVLSLLPDSMLTAQGVEDPALAEATGDALLVAGFSTAHSPAGTPLPTALSPALEHATTSAPNSGFIAPASLRLEELREGLRGGFHSDGRMEARSANPALTAATNTQVLTQSATSDSAKGGAVSLASLETLSNSGLQQLTQNLAQPGGVFTATSAQHQSSPHTPLSTSPSAVNPSPEWASVRVDTSQGKWGEQMMQVLQDRVTLQAQQNMQEARIRLDPPDLGKLDLLVRVEGDRLSVQINANAAATREALVQVSERLRAELQNQNFLHVDVNVGDGESGHQRYGQSDDEATIFAARDIRDDAASDNGFNAAYGDHWLNTQA